MTKEWQWLEEGQVIIEEQLKKEVELNKEELGFSERISVKYESDHYKGMYVLGFSMGYFEGKKASEALQVELAEAKSLLMKQGN